MTTPLNSPEQLPLKVRQRRVSRAEEIVRYFRKRMGKEIPSWKLHRTFGTAFRSRVSEINRDPGCPLRIVNGYATDDYSGAEQSWYRGELR